MTNNKDKANKVMLAATVAAMVGLAEDTTEANVPSMIKPIDKPDWGFNQGLDSGWSPFSSFPDLVYHNKTPEYKCGLPGCEKKTKKGYCCNNR